MLEAPPQVGLSVHTTRPPRRRSKEVVYGVVGARRDVGGRISERSRNRGQSARTMNWILLTIGARIGIGAILVAAGASKALMGRSSTGRLISSYRLAPRSLVPWLAVALPTLEMCVGVALMLGVWLPVTDRVAFVLIAVLTVIAAITAVRGLKPTCGCFGRAFETAVSPEVILRNTVLVIALGFVLRFDVPMPATVDSVGASPLLTAPAVLVVAVASAMLMFRRASHGS